MVANFIRQAYSYITYRGQQNLVSELKSHATIDLNVKNQTFGNVLKKFRLISCVAKFFVKANLEMVMKSFNLSKKSFAKIKQRGQGMSEYIIIVALIAVGAIGVFTAFGGVIRQQVAGMAMELSGKDGTANVTTSQSDAAGGVKSANTVTNMGSYAGQTKNSAQAK